MVRSLEQLLELLPKPREHRASPEPRFLLLRAPLTEPPEPGERWSPF